MSGRREWQLPALLTARCAMAMMLLGSSAGELCFSGSYFNGTECHPCAEKPANSRWLTSSRTKCAWLCDMGYTERSGSCLPCSGECRSYDIELLQLELSDPAASLELVFELCSVLCDRFDLLFMDVLSPALGMCTCAFKEHMPTISDITTEQPQSPDACDIFPAEPYVTRIAQVSIRGVSSPSRVVIHKESPDSAIACYQVSPTTIDLFCLVYGNLTSGTALIADDGTQATRNTTYMHVRSTFLPLLMHRDGVASCKSCMVGRFLNFIPVPVETRSSVLADTTFVPSFLSEITNERSIAMVACARLAKSLSFPYFCLGAGTHDGCYAMSSAGSTRKESSWTCWSVELACDDCSPPPGWYGSAFNFTSSGLPLLNQSCEVECPSDSYTIAGFERISSLEYRDITVCYDKRTWGLIRAAYVLPIPLGVFVIAVAIHFERKMKRSRSECAECRSKWTSNMCPIDGLPLAPKLTLEDINIDLEEDFEYDVAANLSCPCASQQVTGVLACGHGSCKYETCTRCGCLSTQRRWWRSSRWWIPLPVLAFTCFISWSIGVALYVGDWLSWIKFWWTLFACIHASLLIVYLRTCAYKAKCMRNDCCPCYSRVPVKELPVGFQNALIFLMFTFAIQFTLTSLSLQLDSELAQHYGGCWWIDCLMYTHVDYRVFCPMCTEQKMLYHKAQSRLNILCMMLGFPCMVGSLICCIRTLHFSIVMGIRICCVCANRRINEFSRFSGCFQGFSLNESKELFRWPESCSRCKQRIWDDDQMLDSFLHQRRTGRLIGLLKRLSLFVTLRRLFQGARRFYSYKALGSAPNDRLDIEMTAGTRQQRRKPSAPVVKGWKDYPFLTFQASEQTGSLELVYDGNPLPKLLIISGLPSGFFFDEATGDLRWDLQEEEKKFHYQLDLIATNYVGECKHSANLYFCPEPSPPNSLSYTCSRSLRCQCGGTLTRYSGWGIKVTCNSCGAVGETDRLDWFVCRASRCSFDLCPRCAGRNQSCPDQGDTVIQLYHDVEMYAWSPLLCFFPGFPLPTFFAANLPDGLSIDVLTGKVSGTPAACGMWMVTVTAANPAGACETNFLVEVVSFEPPHDLSYTNVSTAFTGNQFSFEESVAHLQDRYQSSASAEACLIPSWGGTITRFSIYPALPSGVRIDQQTGVISGVAKSAMPTMSFTVMGSGPGRMYCCANLRLKFARVLEPKIQYPNEGMRKIPLGVQVKIEPINTQTSATGRYTNRPLLHRLLFEPLEEPEPEKVEPHLVCIRIDIRPPLPDGLAVDEDGIICGVARRPTPATTYSVVVRNEKGFSSSEVSFEILRADGRPAARPRSRILAFFTTPQGYESVNVHGEAQEMMRRHMEPEFAFDCDVNPQPTFSDFKKFLTSHHGFNVRVLHFAGHGEQHFGFIWNHENPSVSTPAVYDMGELCDIVGKVAAGQTLTGTVECVVLNACQTEMLGKRLRSAGVRNVVCWRTKVKDKTAMKFTNAFYDHFMGKEKIEEKDYLQAFREAKERIEQSNNSDDANSPSRALVRKPKSGSNIDLVVLLSARGDVLPGQTDR